MNKESCMRLQNASMIAGAVALATLAGCAYNDPYGPNNYPASSINPNPAGVAATGPYGATYPAPASAYPAQPVAGVEYGRVVNVVLLSPGTTAPANSTNTTIGTIGGAVVGGLLGNQVGRGNGRAAATILGAVGGGVLGNRIGQNNTPQYQTSGPVYRVTVQTDSGVVRTYDVSAVGDLHAGDRVRIENGMIYLG
jgi:outer membrane lipoprotein SlyB